MPTEDDRISRIEHMGKETVRKLSNLQAAAAQVGAGSMRNHMPSTQLRSADDDDAECNAMGLDVPDNYEACFVYIILARAMHACPAHPFC